MVCHALRTQLSILCRIARKHLGQDDNASALERRFTRDDLAAWIVNPEGFGPDTWAELRGAIDAGFAIAKQYDIPQLQQQASNALRAMENANVLVEDAVRARRALVVPAANRNARSHLSLVPAPQKHLVASEDGHAVVSLAAVKVSMGTVPCPPSGGQAA